MTRRGGSDGSGKDSVLFLAAIWSTLRAFVAPIARDYATLGLRTIGAAAGSPEDTSAFDSCAVVHDFRRRGPRHLAIAALDVARLVKEQQVRLLHLHTPIAVAMGRIIGKLTGVPSIVVVHGTFLGVGGVTERAFRTTERVTAPFAASTVVLNDEDARFYRSFVDPRRVTVAPAGGAGIAVHALRRALARARPDAMPTVGVVGRITRDKNPEFIVDALRSLRAAGVEVRLRFIGGQERTERGWAVPSEPWIETTGWLADPYPTIASCTVIASASRREGFGMGVAEALVLGKPVVALPNAGVRQQARMAGDRLTLTATEVGEFAAAIRRAIDQPPGSGIQEDLAKAWSREGIVRFHRERLVDLFPAFGT